MKVVRDSSCSPSLVRLVCVYAVRLQIFFPQPEFEQITAAKVYELPLTSDLPKY